MNRTVSVNAQALLVACVMGVFCLVLILLVQGSHAQEKKDGAPPAKLEAVQQPSKEWLENYEAFLVLQRVIGEMKKEAGIDKLEERLNQKGLALQAGVPQGYSFDQNKKQFVAIAKAQEPAKK